MATSSTVIANMALGHIGSKGEIVTLGSDGSEEDDACNFWYNIARKEVLEIHNWGFARKRAALTAHADDPDEVNWAYRFQYPSDALIIRRIVSPYGYVGDRVPFEIELSDDDTEKTILCNLDTATAVYTFDCTTTTMFTPSFDNTLSWLLAAKVAFRLTGDRQIERQCMETYYAMLPIDRAVNAGEGQDQGPREASSIRARD